MAEWLRGFSGLRFRVAVGVVVLSASLTALILGQKPKPVATRSIEARLELAAGDVTLKDGVESGTVISGIPLPDGVELTTGKGARALVRLSDGSAVFLRGDTELGLTRTGIALTRGEVWLDAPASERGGCPPTGRGDRLGGRRRPLAPARGGGRDNPNPPLATT